MIRGRGRKIKMEEEDVKAQKHQKRDIADTQFSILAIDKHIFFSIKAFLLLIQQKIFLMDDLKHFYPSKVDLQSQCTLYNAANRKTRDFVTSIDLKCLQSQVQPYFRAGVFPSFHIIYFTSFNDELPEARPHRKLI